MFRVTLMAIAALLCLTGVTACWTGVDSLTQCRNVFSQLDAKNCQLTSADSVGLRFEKWVAGTSAQIRIFTQSGIMVQKVSSRIGGSAESGVMLLGDLDGDGRDELLLSLDTVGAQPN